MHTRRGRTGTLDRHLRSTAASVALLIALSGGLAWQAIPAQAALEVHGIVYRTAGSVSIKLDVYMPDGPGPFPAIVLVHGGDWRDGWRGDMKDTALELANRGVVSFAIDFRMPCHPDNIKPDVDPNLCGYPFPTPVTDVGAAVAWVRRHASQFKAFAGRAGIVGTSSGGNMSMEIGALGKPGKSQPDAIVSWSGRGDLTTDRSDGAHNRRNYLGCDYTACPDKWVNASPSRVVGPGDSPLYLSGGEYDTGAPAKDEQQTINAWIAQGNPERWHLVLGSDCHGRTCLTADPTIWGESVAWIYQWVSPPAA